MPRLSQRDLTNARIASVKPPRNGRVEVTDRAVRGLCFAVSASGVRSWILTCSRNGRRTRTVLGHYPGMTLKDARLVATAAKDNSTAPKPQEPDGDTFATLAEKYIARGMVHRTGPRAGKPHKNAAKTERLIRKEILPAWGNRAVATLTKKDATGLTDAIIDRGSASTANVVHQTYHAIMNWAVRRGEIEANPFSLMGLPAAKIERDRVLSPNEIRAIWDGCYMMGYPFGPMYRLLLLTGQRRDEVSGLRWRELDLDARMWRIPGERTKSGLPHDLPLSSLAMQEIENLPHSTVSDYVFSTTDGEKPVSGFSRSKRRLDRFSGVKNWRGHDLRRCVRTGMAELGVPEIVAERVLNHSERNALVRTYNRHPYTEEKRDALERWAGHVRDLTAREAAGIVQFSQSKVILAD